MNKERLLAHLGKQPKGILMESLGAAYDEMTTRQRQAVFGRFEEKAKPPSIDGKKLLKGVQEFQRESLAGRYYAPFDINSKNFTHIPEETDAWFDRMGDFLSDSARLSAQGDHTHAVACFRILYELVDALGRGDEIVFADECGTWMIPVDEKPIMAAYFVSLAATTTPEEYVAAVVPLLRRDSFESFSHKAYPAATRAANKAQKAHLKAEVERLGVKTAPERRW